MKIIPLKMSTLLSLSHWIKLIIHCSGDTKKQIIIPLHSIKLKLYRKEIEIKLRTINFMSDLFQ